MKRLLSSFAVTVSVPLAALFVLTARPARLYAESSVRSECSAPEIAACASKSIGEACDDGGAVCHSDLCANADGGASTAALRCKRVTRCADQNRIDDCAGKSASQSCGTPGGGGACRQISCPALDGGFDPLLACFSMGVADGGTDPERPDSGANSSDESGCRAAGSSSKSTLGSAFGSLLAIAALFGLRRKRS